MRLQSIMQEVKKQLEHQTVFEECKNGRDRRGITSTDLNHILPAVRRAAMAYILSSDDRYVPHAQVWWPWSDVKMWLPRSARVSLIRAIAFLVLEIERIDKKEEIVHDEVCDG